jgi:uncharacterized protein (TIRG00374 family)
VNKRNWRPQTTISIGFVLSALFLWMALHKVDSNSLRSAFSTINYLLVLVCACALAFSVVLRAVRWRVIATCAGTSQLNFLRATNLGVLSNLLFPGRAGEFIRSVTLAKLSSLPLSRIVASALIERLADVFVLTASTLLLYLLLPISPLLKTWLIYLLIGGFVATVTLVVLAKGSGDWAAIFVNIARRGLRKWPLRAESFLIEFRAECRRLLRGWLGVELALVAVLIFFVDYIAIVLLLLAFDISFPIEAPLLLWVFLAAGSALPSAPGYVGVYQAAAVLALSYFAVPASTAVALATALQITTLSVALLMSGPGVFSLIKRPSAAEPIAE